MLALSPPSSHRLPCASVQLAEMLLVPPGVFAGAGIPSVPRTSGCRLLPAPAIHAHWCDVGSYFQRSLSALIPSPPYPPNNQRLPLLSVHAAADERLGGIFPSSGTPNVPYAPAWYPSRTSTTSLPPIQTHWCVERSNIHKSFS